MTLQQLLGIERKSLHPKGSDMKASVDRLLSLEETAGILGIPKRTLYQMNWKGTGPRSYKVGRYRKYDPADIKVWLQNRVSA